ncbi:MULTISPECIES: transcriptional regulator NodD1 [Rhizobium]|uniref:Nodulation protein D 1 n=5 Tax=Rhizobium TaxID=379 RepID=NODD1_RHILP|nr:MULTISPECIES: transcriptional regulator NodD1 [Rhizobium]P23718.1 RecName: Full=Nodulation protein D 1 [Rhizobium leguminosarum bv. phaseoli]APO77662.1 transcriptional regulator nodulation protein NodD 1 [Rhizobium etli 8C-3]MBB5668414.1 LysR family nod box-dependent transcriptional activator [Rhizobium leguminosarum]MBB6225755.1 LysR family nod box-dependent transcriptional activator [Rhizobium leguminosarum]MBY4593764.1 transcriptional regulator NodD1 [Rhizobium redzepovicii]MBY4611988.1
MRFKGLDLNLLVALDALMTERNLTAAARSINLSQPAMSAAVGRLRTYFNDDLFTMVGRELVPTPRAERLAPSVREALLHIQVSIISWDPFCPAQSDRCFRVILSDYAALVFFEKVVTRVAREAPAVSFELLPIADNYDEYLRRGDADFLIFPELLMSRAHPKVALFEETLVCVGCHSNKLLSEQLTLERYMSMGHVVVKFGNARTASFEEWCLLGHGLKRHVEVVVQGFSMVPFMLSGTERIATMPLRLVKQLEKTIPLRIADLPLPLPAFTQALQWPALHNSGQASLWMRDVLCQEASRMPSPHEVMRRLRIS